MAAAAHDRELLLSAAFLRKLEALALVSRRRSASRERGERGSSGAGSGVAFSTHRAYAAGDDPRFVDWKLFARSERLYLKQFEEERDLSVHLLLDCSASMASKLDYACALAGALGYLALVNLDQVSVQPYRELPAARLAPLRGKNRALVLLRYLSAQQAHGKTSLGAAARAVCVHAQRGGLALVLSDGLDDAGLLGGIDLLRYGRLEPVLLLLEDAREHALTGDLTLVDSESGEQRTLHIDERARERVEEARQQRLTGLRRALHERRVPAVVLDVALPLERAVFQLLRRGGVVR
jgi:uncharacterized protein (DUF58 family)